MSKVDLARLKFMLKIYKFDIEVKDHVHTGVMNIYKKVMARTKSHVKNPINLTLRSKVNIMSGSWMYVTYPLMVIDACAKYCMPKPKQTKVTGWTQRYDKNLYIWHWDQRYMSNRDHQCTQHILSYVIKAFAKHDKPTSNQEKIMSRTRKHDKTPINLTLRQKLNVVPGSLMCAMHLLMVIHPGAKYGKQMSNQKKIIGRTRICTDRRTEWFLCSPELRSRGFKRY